MPPGGIGAPGEPAARIERVAGAPGQGVGLAHQPAGGIVVPGEVGQVSVAIVVVAGGAGRAVGAAGELGARAPAERVVPAAASDSDHAAGNRMDWTSTGWHG